VEKTRKTAFQGADFYVFYHDLMFLYKYY